MLSTWSFGAKANGAGWPVLVSPGGTSLDAVEAACRAVESDPEIDSVGVGGLPDASGEVSLDGCIMLSPERSAGVGYVRRFDHPVSIARQLMQRTRHKLLVGAGAERFAEEEGFEPVPSLLTDAARAQWTAWRVGRPAAPRGPSDTIGVLALDASGILAGACSTSGTRFKLPGRVGDSPIIGHGLFVVPGLGAAVGTGTGELFMGTCASFHAVELLRGGASPAEAAAGAVRRIADSFRLQAGDQAAIIVLTHRGEWSSAALRPRFQVALRTRRRDELLDPDHVLLSDPDRALPKPDTRT